MKHFILPVLALFFLSACGEEDPKELCSLHYGDTEPKGSMEQRGKPTKFFRDMDKDERAKLHKICQANKIEIKRKRQDSSLYRTSLACSAHTSNCSRINHVENPPKIMRLLD